MERTIISWNGPNWLTVLLMAAAGYALLGLVSQVLKQQQSAGGYTLGLGLGSGG